MRADARQSIQRTSSPFDILAVDQTQNPHPFCADRVSPTKDPLNNLRVTISIFFILRIMSSDNNTNHN